jgi:hypothetical protein
LWELPLSKICCSRTVPGGQAGSEYRSVMIVKVKKLQTGRSGGLETGEDRK